MITKESFTEIYNLYVQKVFNLAYKMLGDKDIAEDITQEAFIQVYYNLQNFRGDSKIYTWIYRIVKNQCLQYISINQRKSFRSLEELTKKASVVPGDKYEENEMKFYIMQVKNGCLLGLLRCLSFNQRIAFIIGVLYEIPLADVSEIMGKSENSTRILIHRARKNIKAFICDNCSLYNKNNYCNCANLISFSMEKGWVEKYKPSVTPEIIENEIKELKNEIDLYKTIALKKEPDSLREKVYSLITEKKYSLLSRQKVK